MQKSVCDCTNEYDYDLSLEGNASETHHGFDLESCTKVSETEASSFLASGRSLFGKVWGTLGFTQRGNGLVGGHTRVSGVQYEVHCGCQHKEVKMGFTESVVSGFKKQGSKDLDLVKTENGVARSTEKIGHGNAKVASKPGWKKPPRPPRAGTAPSKERHIKSISDADLLRRARLDRIRSLRKQRVKERSSTKTTLWALLFTVFFAIVIIQGIFSQGSVSSPHSSAKPGQTSPPLHKFSSDGSNTESRQTV
ncbi:uncharacterized protein LOC131068000 isoform X1 [Cryptomeria japonica]|uniref:uncharacterized protein LOC131068000 isoform X1 n=1 Tax=Cryptomeria japonica TaxID=3369 RepID=UPI0025AB61E1|nr:uncharacterized protein LOC131068000 isoform X1 [Cryptomeria japonica]